MRVPLAAAATSPAGIATAAAAAAAVAAMCIRKALKPTVQGQSTPWNSAILSLCPSLTASYRLPALLNNGHVETIFAAWFRRKPHILYDRELLHMPDGGCVALDTEDLPPAQQLPEDAPVLILLPGLTGGSEDSYVQYAVVHAREAGIRAVVFNSRGTSDSPVSTAQFYSASFTEDMRNVVAHVRNRYPRSLLFAAGWSLGANIMTRYLGEEQDRTPISAAVAMCNPFNLPLSDANFKKGFNRIYDWNLARSLNRIYSKHHHLFEEEAASASGRPYRPDVAIQAKTIREFDDSITRVAFGWPSVDAYYTGSSSSLSIPDVRVPLLIIQAEDDPIAPKEAIPFEAIEANPQCLLVLTPTGGHLGWCGGRDGVTGAPWTDAAVAEFFTAAKQLLAQPEFAAAAEAAKARQPAPAEPAGVWTSGTTTHQAP
jgi:predicted alpha/beta-fold hydrolase